MLAAFLIVALGLTPSILSLWIMRKANAQAQERLRLTMNAVAQQRLLMLRLPPDYRYIEGIGYMIGDLTCQFNARSHHLRCAVNPTGPCSSCSHYQTRQLEDQSQTL